MESTILDAISAMQGYIDPFILVEQAKILARQHSFVYDNLIQFGNLGDFVLHISCQGQFNHYHQQIL